MVTDIIIFVKNYSMIFGQKLEIIQIILSISGRHWKGYLFG